MTTISLRLPDDLLKNAETTAKAMKIPRAEYIRRAIDAMNGEALARERRKQLARASLRVREESLRVNAEFGAIEHDPEV